MEKMATRCLAVIVALAVSAGTCRAEEPKGEAKSGNMLVGTWKLAFAKYGGQEQNFSEWGTTLKHVTPAQFMWVTYNEDGKVTRGAGGGYVLKDDVYEQTPEYGIGSDFDLFKGNVHT